MEIALCNAHMARRFDVTPRVALLCFFSFGGVDHPISAKMRKAVELIKYSDPRLIVDGEIMADEAPFGYAPRKMVTASKEMRH